jgi:beta-lactamase class A
MKRLVLATLTILCATGAQAGTLDAAALRRDAVKLIQPFHGGVGFCARAVAQLVCLRGDDAFPMQSVMKLLVAVAVMDAVDHGRLRLDEPVTLHLSDLSMNVQPIADLVRKTGSYETTIDDLMTRAVIDSDSAATDFLIARLDGPQGMQMALRRLGVTGIRIDRDERHLQTETAGLVWEPAFVDLEALKAAVRVRPSSRRQAAFHDYLRDPRDRGSPAAMTLLLQRLADGTLLSRQSCAHLMDVLSRTRTFPGRLKAGLQPGWSVAHKTGTGGMVDGITSAANDVGVLTAPDGARIAVAVFVTGTGEADKDQDALMASLARAVVKSYRPN